MVSCGDDDNSDGSPEKNVQDKVFTVNGVSFKMIAVKGGMFTMRVTSGQTGAYPDDSPTHIVTLSDYYIGETEVTQELWSAVMGNNPSNFKGNMQRPVECVSWDDSQAFITKLNELTGETFCLPTEAQWEYAARGGNLSKDFLYSGGNNIEEVAWYKDNSNKRTHPVKTKRPNELGIYDMSGNVWEWGSGYWYDGGRVGFGGSWRDEEGLCTFRSRTVSLPTIGGETPGIKEDDLGLRLAH